MRISGDYQYNALTRGFYVQRNWHDNKLYLIDLLNLSGRNKTLGDVGCGSGNLLFRYKDKFKTLLGFDNNSDALEFIEKRIVDEKARNISVITEDLENVVYDRKFDVVTCMEVIEHFDLESLRKGVFQNILGFVKKGGKILITTPNRKSIWPLLERLLDLFGLVPNMANEQHFSSFTMRELHSLLEEYGFDVEYMGSFNHVSPFLPFKFLRGLVLKAEVKYISRYGPLLYVVATRESD